MGDRTVLVVDDHDVLRGLLQSRLREWFPGVRIVEASNGEAAVARTSSERPDVVIMDITLPGMNGIEATKAIKRLHPEIPVVMLTVHELEAYRSDAVAAGADAYVPKRQMQAELYATLSGFLADPLNSPAATEVTQ